MAGKRSADLRHGLLAAGSVLGALVLGQTATFPNLEPWYAGLVKPTFTPPNWLFGPAWATLYALMAVAFWRILRQPDGAARRLAVVLFYLQLALNAAWSWLFFATHSPLLGLIDIGPQLIAIVATIAAFHRLDRLASACLVPLALWVGYATLLNAAIWTLNG